MSTKIEWVKNQDGTQGYTINPVKGMCPVDCKDSQGKSYCYARRMYKRFKWNPEIRLDRSVFWGLPEKPSRIFVGSTMELFYGGFTRNYMHFILGCCRTLKQHTFIFLTKQPQNLIKWSPFPKNCWIGVSATNMQDFAIACGYFRDIEASVRFISFEPLLGMFIGSMLDIMLIKMAGINWIIIGQQTPVSIQTQPKIEWIKAIVEAADKAKVPVFLKDNLEPLLVTIKGDNKYAPLWANGGYGKLRQEFPKEKQELEI